MGCVVLRPLQSVRKDRAKRCRAACLLLFNKRLGLHKDMSRFIAQLVWSTRNDGQWDRTVH
jgi:hypothetical protein